MNIIIFLILRGIFLPEQVCNANVPTYFDPTFKKELKLDLNSVKDYNLQLYDNWGIEVYNLDNSEIGTYYYKIDFSCKNGNTKTKEGEIQLIKTSRK
jgi:hypothetical protein